MNTSLKPKKAMSKEEVSLLVDLVVSKPILTRKETNAATNKMKEDAWVSITADFNSISGQSRSKDQIKLKWDNLKKAARKRILQADLKSGRDTPDLIPPDDILEKVSGLLSVQQSDAPFSGDWIVVDSVGESFTNTAQKRKMETALEACDNKCKETRKFQTHAGKKVGAGVKERNLAIARYYDKKTEKLDLEIQLLKKQLNNKCKCIKDTEMNLHKSDVNNSEHVKNTITKNEVTNGYVRHEISSP